MNTHVNNLLTKGLFLLAITTLPGCNTITDKPPTTEFSAVELSWQQRSTEEMAKRVSALAELIGIEANSTYLAEMLSDQDSLGNWQTLRDGNSDLLFKVLPDHDEIRMVNTRLAESTEALKLDEQQAIEMASDTLQSLAKQNLLNGLGYQPDKYQIGYHRIGSGSTDGKQAEDTVVGYRITFLPHIDDIPLANAGVRIAVHRSGKLSGIRIGGVSASQGADKELGRQVSDDEIKKRFDASIPNGMEPRIAWQRIMYVMPEDERSAVVYPTHTISYSLVGDSEQGEVISRRKTVGLSLVDGEVEIIDYLKPAAKHQTIRLSRDAKQDDSLNKQVMQADDDTH